MKVRLCFLCVLCALQLEPSPAHAQPGAPVPVPDKLVVLTFDDSVKSHATFVGPLLKKLGFGATFFITEGFTFATDKTSYMTWEEIKELDDAGFEIGNHTRAHQSVTEQTPEQFQADLTHIEEQCARHGIRRPVTFAYPGNGLAAHAVGVLDRAGYQFARRGGAPEFPYKEGRGRGYDPAADHPLLIPSAGDARPFWKMEDFEQAISVAKEGRIAVLQFHGVPDVEHPWVHTDPKFFEACMNRLKSGGFTVIALRDLARYVDPSKKPEGAFEKLGVKP